MSSRYSVRVVKGRRCVIIDIKTGAEARIDGSAYGEMPATVAEFGADLLNWLENNPPLSIRGWEELGDGDVS